MLFQLIPVAEASVSSLMKSINTVIINPLIIFVFALALVYFIVGLVNYLLNPESKDVHEKSKDQMLYGIIGMFIMVSVFGIMNIILTSIGETDIEVENNEITIGEVLK